MYIYRYVCVSYVNTNKFAVVVIHYGPLKKKLNPCNEMRRYVKIPTMRDEPKYYILLRHPCVSHRYQLVYIKSLNTPIPNLP